MSIHTGHVLCWRCAYRVLFESSGRVKGSLLAPALDLTIAGAAPQPAGPTMGGKGQEQAQEWDCLWEAMSSLTQVSTLGWRLPQAISWIAKSLSGRSWRNSSICLFLYVR